MPSKVITLLFTITFGAQLNAPNSFAVLISRCRHHHLHYMVIVFSNMFINVYRHHSTLPTSHVCVCQERTKFVVGSRERRIGIFTLSMSSAGQQRCAAHKYSLRSMWFVQFREAISNKCIATSNRCLTSSNRCLTSSNNVCYY